MLTRADIEQYFIAEKNAAVFMMLAGAAAILAAIVLLVFFKTGLTRGMAAGFVVLGLLQLFLGYSAYRREEALKNRRIEAVYSFDLDPGKLKIKELPEVVRSVRAIQRFLIIEGVILMVGAFLWIYYRQGNPLLAGVGIALVIAGLIMTGTEYFVYRHNKIYLRQLEIFTAK